VEALIKTSELTTSEAKLASARKIHSLIEECMLINGIEDKDSIPAIFYHLIILLSANDVSRKEVSKGLNMIKKYHSDNLERRGL
jgi:phosphoribosyl-ATP pyrophosphohydrolase